MPLELVLALLMDAGVRESAAPRHYPHFDMTGVVTFPFDDVHLLDRAHHDAGAVWVTPNARPGARLPLYIYLHGLNRDRVLHRWMHGSHWDMRTIVGPMTMEGIVGPMAVVVVATTGDSAQAAATIYPRMNVPALVDSADRALGPSGFHIDRSRVTFSSHSASGCEMGNGLYAAVGSPAVQTVFDIDCCMDARFGRALATAPPWQRVIAVYQDYMWRNGRSFESFTSTFTRLSSLSANPMNRVLEHYTMAGIDVHNDIVPVTLRRWLPALVPPVPPTPASLPVR